MLPHHRPSILWRPRGQPSKCNEETAEIEYQRYQSRLAALQQRASQQEARLLSRIYPPNGQDLTHSDQDYLKQQREPSSRPIEFDQQSHSGGSKMQHPWCLEPQDTESATRDAIRRKESQATMRQNMAMAEAKKQQLDLERARERSIASSTVQSEKQWWNYGAASEKWIPPEHRVRGRSSKAISAEALHGAANDILHWHEDTPRSSQSQVSIATSCSQTAPYATSDNAPAQRRSGYRPTAPFHTEPDGGCNLTSAASPRPRGDSRAGSTRPPFSLHNEPAESGECARPHRRDSRPGTARSAAAPFDRDGQPPPPPRRALFRTGYNTGQQCPYDRDDLVVPPRPRQIESKYPYATSECAPQRALHSLRHEKGSMRTYDERSTGGENEGAVSNVNPAAVPAAGRPSPQKQDSPQRLQGGGRGSPESVKHANDVTAEEVPLMFPFVATAAGTVPAQQHATRPHTPEAPRHMSRGTPASIARWQEMQRGDGVNAALHAYAGYGSHGQDGDEEGGRAGSERSGTRPEVDALVSKHVAGSGRYSVSAGQRPAAGWAASDGTHADGGSTRAPYATLVDTASRATSMHGRPHLHSSQRGGPPQDQTGVQGGGGVMEGSRYMRGTDRGAFQHGHEYVQPEWMHVQRPAGVATATGRDEVWDSKPRMSGGHASTHTDDHVGKIMRHNEATVRASPGGEMFGVIDELARKYGAHSLK
eukprot:jgi/Ulvmu1/8407/UM042_0114.1